MKKKILVVDDEMNIGLLLENILTPAFEVTYHANSGDAVRWLEGHLPDLIICDIEMPGMDGYAFLGHVRQRGFTQHTPVIMLSARSESRERIKCYRLGAQDYLTKPFNPEELDEIIKKNLFPLHATSPW